MVTADATFHALGFTPDASGLLVLGDRGLRIIALAEREELYASTALAGSCGVIGLDAEGRVVAASARGERVRLEILRSRAADEETPGPS